MMLIIHTVTLLFVLVASVLCVNVIHGKGHLPERIGFAFLGGGALGQLLTYWFGVQGIEFSRMCSHVGMCAIAYSILIGHWPLIVAGLHKWDGQDRRDKKTAGDKLAEDWQRKGRPP